MPPGPPHTFASDETSPWDSSQPLDYLLYHTFHLGPVRHVVTLLALDVLAERTEGAERGVAPSVRRATEDLLEVNRASDVRPHRRQRHEGLTAERTPIPTPVPPQLRLDLLEATIDTVLTFARLLVSARDGGDVIAIDVNGDADDILEAATRGACPGLEVDENRGDGHEPLIASGRRALHLSALVCG